jgi:hypothetical protein
MSAIYIITIVSIIITMHEIYAVHGVWKSINAIKIKIIHSMPLCFYLVGTFMFISTCLNHH